MLSNFDFESLPSNDRASIGSQPRLGRTPGITQDELEDLLAFLRKDYIA